MDEKRCNCCNLFGHLLVGLIQPCQILGVSVTDQEKIERLAESLSSLLYIMVSLTWDIQNRYGIDLTDLHNDFYNERKRVNEILGL